MRMRLKKQPEILKLKIEVALLIKKKCAKVNDGDFNPPHGCYWKGKYQFGDKIIYIYWQNYTRGFRRMTCEYIKIYWMPHYETIYKKELLKIKEELTKEL